MQLIGQKPKLPVASPSLSLSLGGAVEVKCMQGELRISRAGGESMELDKKPNPLENGISKHHRIQEHY